MYPVIALAVSGFFLGSLLTPAQAEASPRNAVQRDWIDVVQGEWINWESYMRIDGNTGIATTRSYRWCHLGQPQPCDYYIGSKVVGGWIQTFVIERLERSLHSDSFVGRMTSDNWSAGNEVFVLNRWLDGTGTVSASTGWGQHYCRPWSYAPEICG